MKPGADHYPSRVGHSEQQKLKSLRRPRRSALSGFGVFGIVGWSVAVPTVAGALGGMWLDHHYPQSFSWTLTLLIGGLMAGCFTAWHWVGTEHKDMHHHQEDDQHE